MNGKEIHSTGDSKRNQEETISLQPKDGVGLSLDLRSQGERPKEKRADREGDGEGRQE